MNETNSFVFDLFNYINYLIYFLLKMFINLYIWEYKHYLLKFEIWKNSTLNRTIIIEIWEHQFELKQYQNN